LTFISTIATPLFFVVAGYLDSQSRHDALAVGQNQKRGDRLSVLDDGVLSLGALPARLSYPAVVCFCLYRDLHLSPAYRVAQPATQAFFAAVFTLLLLSYGYDLLSALYPDVHALSLAPQYRLWTWLLFYLTGQLFSDPLVADWLRREKVVKGAMIAIPFIYLFTWFYERHFFFALFKADRNAFILTGSQIYILVVALVIAANGVRFRKNSEFKETILATISKTMTGVYILHYSVFHLLTALIPINSLGTKLMLIVLTFITSVLISMLALSNSVVKKVITI
jgi:surface polysaccharide O-acyltransferase-like enzyme